MEKSPTFSELRDILKPEQTQRRLKLRPIKDEIRDLQFQLASGDPEVLSTTEEQLSDLKIRFLSVSETDSHIALMESFDPHFQDMALELTAQFIEENGCTTMVEKMQAELLVNAFLRVLADSRRLNETLREQAYGGATKEQSRHIAILSKQVDRANRQFLSAVMVFKHWRAAPVSLSVKTTNISQTIVA